MKLLAKILRTISIALIFVSCSNQSNHTEQTLKFDGLIPFRYLDESSPTLVSKEFVYLDSKGREVLKSSDIEGLDTSVFSEMTPPLFSDNGLAYYPMLRAYIDTRGRQVIKLKDYDAIEASGFWEDRAVVLSLKKRAYVVIDGKGRELFTIPLDSMEPVSLFNNGYIVLYSEMSGRCRYIDRDGNVALDSSPKKSGYRLSSELNRYGLILAYKTFGDEPLFGAINISGEVVIDFVYDTILPFDNNGYAIVQRDGKYGMINTQGDVVVPIESNEPIRHCGDNIYGAMVAGDGNTLPRLFDIENNEVAASQLKLCVQMGGRYVASTIDGGGYIARLSDMSKHPKASEAAAPVWVVGLFDGEGRLISNGKRPYALTSSPAANNVTYLTAIDSYYYYGRPYTNLSTGAGITY